MNKAVFVCVLAAAVFCASCNVNVLPDAVKEKVKLLPDYQGQFIDDPEDAMEFAVEVKNTVMTAIKAAEAASISEGEEEETDHSRKSVNALIEYNGVKMDIMRNVSIQGVYEITQFGSIEGAYNDFSILGDFYIGGSLEIVLDGGDAVCDLIQNNAYSVSKNGYGMKLYFSTSAKGLAERGDIYGAVASASTQYIIYDSTNSPRYDFVYP